jgi:hypothetical protein
MRYLPLFIIIITSLLASCSELEDLFRNDEPYANLYCGQLVAEEGKKNILITWENSRDTYMHKQGAKYILYYSEQEITTDNLTSVNKFEINHKCSQVSQDSTYNLALGAYLSLDIGKTYYYRLKAIPADFTTAKGATIKLSKSKLSNQLSIIVK